MYKMIAGFITGLAVVLVASAALARPQCSPRDSVLEQLAKKYQETPIAAGVTNAGGLIEVLANDKTGTWTIMVTTPQGISCYVASGEGWRSVEQVDLNPAA